MGTGEPPEAPVAPHTSGTIAVGPIEIDCALREVRYEGVPAAIQQQAFLVLLHLVNHRDRVVPKEELLDRIWGDRFVSESALTSQIKAARRAVGDDGTRQEVIRTVHGVGYRFVAHVDRAGGRSVGPPPSAAPLADDTGIVARAAERDDVERLLATERVVTILGPGGVGKSALAAAIGGRWERASGETVFVPLAGVSEPDQVPGAIATALGLRTDVGQASPAVKNALPGRRMLVVLDNFEHVAAAASLVSELAVACLDARFLVTSRARLRLAGEQMYWLEPLAVGHGPHGDVPAAALLFERMARRADHGFALDADTLPRVLSICRRLDGMPLAIEIATAQLRYMSLEALGQRLDRGAVGVIDDAIDRPDRHRSLGSTLDWSFDLLAEPTREALEAVSVAVGPFGVDDAAALAGMEPPAAESALHSLVDTSLLRPVPDAGTVPAFTLLHVVREYALARLEASGRATQVRDAHAHRRADDLEALYVRCLDRPPARWMDDIAGRFGDITEALTWSFGERSAGGRVLVGCRLVGALGLWWPRSGRNREARRWVGSALERVDRLDDAHRARLLLAAGWLEYGDRRTGLAHRHFRDAAAAADRAGLETHRALALAGAGVATDPSDATTSIAPVSEAVTLARRLDQEGLLARTLDLLGEVNRRHGRLDAAVACYRESLDLHRRIGDRYAEAVNLANLGLAAEASGDDMMALRFGVAGLEASWRVGSRVMVGWSLSELAGPLSRVGDVADAATLVGASDAVLSSLGVERGVDEQPTHELTQARIEERLGTARFLQHVSDGLRLGVEDAITFTLDAAASVLEQHDGDVARIH